MKRLRRRAFGVMLGAILILAVCTIANWGGKVQPFEDEEGNIMEGSIAEKRFIEVNGVKLGMFIRGKDIHNPVLLFLHGGPGMPEYFLKDDYPTHLEDYFTVVWLEQRGAGISYDSHIDPKTITMEQFIEDDIEVTKYLCKRFNKEKIYLMAHSWGTSVGIRLAEKEPQLYYAYIAMAQKADQNKSEELAYNYMLDYYEKQGDSKTLKKLKNTRWDAEDYGKIRDSVMHKAGIGTARNMNSVITGVFFPSLACKAYTIPERVNIWRGRIFTRKAWENNGSWNCGVEKDITEIKIPVYFLHGKYDYTVNYDLAKAYYEELKAPVKRFYTFDESAHSPLFEEPEKAVDILVKDVLGE